MSNKQDIINDYQISVLRDLDFLRESMVKKQGLLWTYLPDDMPKPYRVSKSSSGEIWVTYPYDRALRESIRQMFLDAGWKINTERTEAECDAHWLNPMISFIYRIKYDDILIFVEFSTFAEGSTCVKKKIGTTTKEVEVYDFTCGNTEE